MDELYDYLALELDHLQGIGGIHPAILQALARKMFAIEKGVTDWGPEIEGFFMVSDHYLR